MAGWGIGLGITFPLIIGWALFQWLKWKNRYRELKKQQLDESRQMEREYAVLALNRQAEYSALQSQINPHFLYNTLDAIRGEALLSGNENIANMTERLSRFFRYCISNKGDIVTIQDEVRNILDYFYIQEYRFGSKFKLKQDISQACYGYRIPKMSLQPIVENAIYHGLERTKYGGEVTVRIFETQRNVKIEISDDGVGIEEEKLAALNGILQREGRERYKQKSSDMGIALHNVNDRIRLQYGSEYGLHIRSSPGQGTSVNIVIPKISM